VRQSVATRRSDPVASSCEGTARARSSVYGPGSRRDGIIRSTTPWKVDTWVYDTEGKIVRRRVTAAYYVGTRS